MLPRLWRIVARPHVLIALFFLIIAAVTLVNVLQSSNVERMVVQLEPDAEPQPETTIDLYIVQLDGSELVLRTTAPLPNEPSERLSAILTQLKGELEAIDVWPSELPVPTVFVTTLQRQQVAALSFPVPDNLVASLDTELALLSAIEKTALANGAARLLFLQNGEPTGVFLHHVAVRTEP